MNHVSQVCPHTLDLSVCALDTALNFCLTQLRGFFGAVTSRTTVSCWGKDTCEEKAGC